MNYVERQQHLYDLDEDEATEYVLGRFTSPTLNEGEHSFYIYYSEPTPVGNSSGYMAGDVPDDYVQDYIKRGYRIVKISAAGAELICAGKLHEREQGE